MKLLALLAALLLEQARPLRRENRVHAAFRRFAHTLRRDFDGGEFRQGALAWLIAVVPLTLAVLLAAWLLWHLNTVFAWLFSVGVLYVTVGFRGFSNFFGEIERLLQAGDVAGAREQLRRWRREDCSALDSQWIARVAIEQGLIDAHRAVFGPLAWFLAAGPAGAVLYRLAALAREEWSSRAEPQAGVDVPPRRAFGLFAQRAFAFIDWVPARLTAASFAVAGDFQDAVDCWRSQARTWHDASEGILLASGAGALGVKLGGDLPEYDGVRYRASLGTGEAADADFLASAVGLAWRTLVMWVLLAAVVIVANAVG